MDIILACLSPSPSNPKILRAAADMAGGDAELVALFVETPKSPLMSAADRQRLQENMLRAKELGARIETVSGDDVPFQIAEYARLAGIRTIVLGQTDFQPGFFGVRPSLPDRLADYLPDAEIHVIPDRRRGLYFAPHHETVSRRRIVRDVFVSLFMLAACTLLGALLYRSRLSNSSIVMVYLLGVLLTAVITSHRLYSICASVLSLFLFNFFFIQPLYSLKAYEPGYPVTFLAMFLTAIVTGTLASRLKQNAHQAAQAAFRARVISETDQSLAKASSREDILRICAEQSAKLLGRRVLLYETDGGAFRPITGVPAETVSAPEDEEAVRALLNDGQTGNWCYPVRVQENTYAVLRIQEHDPPPELSTQSTLLSVLGECALALENEKNAREKKETAVFAENERLRADLLRSISHDLRTPLMSISGNAEALLTNEDRYDAETRRRLCRDIHEDALWLNSLVENILASTRLESGGANLRLTEELVEDLLEEAMSHVHAEDGRRLTVLPVPEILMVRVDAKLIIQVLVNLIGNALKYTPSGSTIRVSAERVGDMAAVSVADDGPGIADGEKERIFDMFYVGGNTLSGGRRGLGLGLPLCRTIVRAHGGELRLMDNSPHGAVFTFTLPVAEVSQNG